MHIHSISSDTRRNAGTYNLECNTCCVCACTGGERDVNGIGNKLVLLINQVATRVKAAYQISSNVTGEFVAEVD